MTGNTIGQFGQHDRIILKAGLVTVETPTHVHFLGYSHRHLADFAMAVLAI
jgi:hypothetical protein